MKTYLEFIKENIISTFKPEDYAVGDLVVYHGGTELSNDDIKDGGIFTTTSKSGAGWYANEFGDKWVTTMKITINKPLFIDLDPDDLETESVWSKLIEESGIETEIDGSTPFGLVFLIKNPDNKDEMYWSYDTGGLNGYRWTENALDLIFDKNFVKTCLKYGYDGIISSDELHNSSLEVYIPFLKKNINIISSERI